MRSRAASPPETDERRPPDRLPLVLLALSFATLLWARAGGLTLSFWTDEVHSALYYADGGPRTVFGPAYVPNNHVLFNLLAWAATTVLGRAEIVYRLASFVPGILAVALLGWWSWRRLGAWVAVGIVALLTVAPSHAELVPQARGYGLGFLAEAMMLIGASTPAGRSPRRREVLTLGLGAFVGIATLPVMLLPFAGHCAVLVLRREWRRPLARVVGATGLSVLAWYAPMLRAIAVASGQDFGHVVSFAGVLQLPALDLVWLGEDPVPAGLAWLVPLLFWVAVAAGERALAQRGERLLGAQLLAPVLITYGALAVIGLKTVPRFTSYLAVPIAVLLAMGLRGLTDLVAVRWPGAAASLRRPAAVVVGLSLGWVVSRDLENRGVPIEAYREAVQAALAGGRTVVTTNSRWGTAFRWYGGEAVLLPGEEGLDPVLCDRNVAVTLIEYPLLARPFDRACFEGRSVSVGEPIRQRWGRRGEWMRVWVVGPGPGVDRAGSSGSRQ